MPVGSLRAMARKAGRSLKVAERYWNEAKRQVERMKNKPDNKYAYVMGIVKKRLGLENLDLALCGAPAHLILEDVELFSSNRSDREFLWEWEKTLAVVGTCELCRAQVEGEADAAFIDEDGNARIKREVIFEMDRMFEEGGFETEFLHKLFPNVNASYLIHITKGGKQMMSERRKGRGKAKEKVEIRARKLRGRTKCSAEDEDEEGEEMFRGKRIGRGRFGGGRMKTKKRGRGFGRRGMMRGSEEEEDYGF